MVDAPGRDGDDRVRELEGDRVAHLERRRVVHDRDLLRHRLGDLAPTVAGVDAPEPGDAVEHLAAVRGPVVHALGAREQARRGLELAICGERHPERLEGRAVGGIGTHGSRLRGCTAIRIIDTCRTKPRYYASAV